MREAKARGKSRDSPDGQHCVMRETGQEAAQIAGRKRNAASGCGKIRACAVKENGASAVFAARPQVIIEHDHEIVKMVLAPEFLMARAEREGNAPVIARVLGIVAPAIGGLERARRQTPGWARASIWPETAAEKPEGACGRRMVAFPFVMRDTALPDRAGEREGPGQQTASGFAPGRRPPRQPRHRQTADAMPASAALLSPLARPAKLARIAFFVENAHFFTQTKSSKVAPGAIIAMS